MLKATDQIDCKWAWQYALPKNAWIIFNSYIPFLVQKKKLLFKIISLSFDSLIENLSRFVASYSCSRPSSTFTLTVTFSRSLVFMYICTYFNESVHGIYQMISLVRSSTKRKKSKFHSTFFTLFRCHIPVLSQHSETHCQKKWEREEDEAVFVILYSHGMNAFDLFAPNLSFVCTLLLVCVCPLYCVWFHFFVSTPFFIYSLVCFHFNLSRSLWLPC